MTALSIDPNLTEEDFKGCEKTTLKGLIDDNELAVTAYKYMVTDFYFGNIHIGAVNIKIVFDDRITDNVVGMDVISRITRLGIANTDKIYFFKDRSELADHIHSIIGAAVSDNYIN